MLVCTLNGYMMNQDIYCIRRNMCCVRTNQRYLRGHPLTANINTSVNLIYNDKGG